MSPDPAPLALGPGALTLVGLYLLSMVGIGWLGRTRRQGDSLADFYLAGRSMGFAVLFLTLYATQYSGNTLIGYTGIAYRIGYAWTVSVLFMFSIIVGYLLFAPRLVVLARRLEFITPGDFLSYRFASPFLTTAATLMMVYALANFTLAQLKAMGAVVEGLTDGRVPSAYGIVALALIMVVYETLGGMRSVAWTDVIQGLILFVGFGVLLYLIPDMGGGVGAVTATLTRLDPGKVEVPDLETCNTWISYTVLLGGGAAIYPQAIQRLYAGRSVRVLKRSLALMAFMPLTTTLIALVCGITGIAVLPGLQGVDTDQILPRLCAAVMSGSAVGYWLVVVVFAAALAALMSTADSALLSISSMVTRDLYQRHWDPGSTQAQLTRVGKVSSWIIIAVLAGAAIATEKTLVRLLELKFEVLIQVVPCFYLGLHWRRFEARTAVAGMVAGLAIALGMTWAGVPRLAGFHAGVLGLAVNLAICAAGTAAARYRRP
ncbi:MAG: sodium:solute symporter family protein [Gemmatimonadota bacterium]